MITREFNLYLHAGHSIPLVINANQYDRGEQWLFTLFNSDGTKYVPSSGAIVGIKSDKLGIINSGTVDSQGRVVINETQQMTAAVGKAVFELLIDDQSHGTANFIVLVEPKPGDNADLSESDLSLIQQAIDGTSATAIAQGVSDWMDENLTPTTPVVDTSLTVSGAAADSAKVGQEISDLKSTVAIKQALMDLANAVAFKGDDPTGQTYIDALEDALYPPVGLLSITAVYSGGTVYDDVTLNSLKNNLVVTAHYDDGTSEVLLDSMYTLDGTIAVGTQTINVIYSGKSTTFTVVVEHNDYLYVMPSEFVSTGTNREATNLQLATEQTVTFLIDFTATTVQDSSSTHTVDFIFSNKKSDSSTYLALQTIKTSGSNYLWGMGIGYNAGKSLITPAHRNRLTCVLTINADGSSSCSASFKDITANGTVKTFTNNYGVGSAITANAYYLGKELDGTVDNGFIGTVHDFRVYDGEMSSADITDYLANGAS